MFFKQHTSKDLKKKNFFFERYETKYWVFYTERFLLSKGNVTTIAMIVSDKFMFDRSFKIKQFYITGNKVLIKVILRL